MQRPRPLDVDIPDFERDEVAPEEALFTIFTHEQWHRGELLAVLWSEGVEPPPVDRQRLGLELRPEAEHPEHAHGPT